jgi:[lysine-biosynthesis-protein LysW]--L-2-aminoadipate ligase
LSRIGLIYDTIRAEEKAIVESARKKGVELVLTDSKELVLNINECLNYRFGKIVLQRCVSYFRLLHLTAFLEAKDVVVVNSFNTASNAGNKLLTSLALARNKIPTPNTKIAFTRKSSLKALDELGYPAILKPIVGSWGRLIAILKDRESAESIFEDREYMFPLYQIYYIQEKVKRPPRDIRTVVIGDRVVASIYRESGPNNWRTNTALGGKVINCPITKELEDVCLKAARSVGGGILGVDCMESPDGILVHEVNNTVEFRNTIPVTGVDIPSLIIDYLVKISKEF